VVLWRQPGCLARPVGVGKGLDADDPPIADGQERGSGLIDFELVGPADDVHDDRYLITGVVEPQRLNSVPLPSREELTPEAPHTVKAAVTVDGKQRLSYREPLDLRIQETTESVIGHALLELLCGALARKLRVESADQVDVLLRNCPSPRRVRHGFERNALP
jgi:hypothetical protein